MSSGSYHTCVVLCCKSTTKKTPEKLWIKVPMDPNRRNAWLTLARRDPKSFSDKSNIYFCEDHFDLENDMENYVQYKVMGYVKKTKMKPHCIPTRFDCQASSPTNQDSRNADCHQKESAAQVQVTSMQERKHKSVPTEPALAVKKQKMSVLKGTTSSSLNQGDDHCSAVVMDGTERETVWVKLEPVWDEPEAPTSPRDVLEADPWSASGVWVKEEVAVKQEPAGGAEGEAGDPRGGAEGGALHTHTSAATEETRVIVKTESFSEEPQCVSETADPGASETAVPQAPPAPAPGDHDAPRPRKKPGPPKSKEFHSCDICARKFKCASKLMEHTRTHTGERPYPCGVCALRFTKRGNLRKHERVHTGERPYSCDICHKEFRQKGALTEHIRIHTGERPHACKVCKKVFTQMSSLKTHERIHTGEKRFSCEICRKEFTQSGAIREHMRIHTGERPFPCEMCDKVFARLETLKKHARTHTGDKPYSCEVCKKEFTNLGNLRKHERIHTGEKPYGCEKCEKRFTALNSLKIHRVTHTREKRYVCGVCNKRYTDISNLRKHERLHVGGSRASTRELDVGGLKGDA